MMDFSKFKKLTIGGVELKQLFINGIRVWKAGYKNWVKYSTEADGVTIYNGGLGYKDGCRIRSGGEEQSGNIGITVTGYIPLKNGETLRIYPPFAGQNTPNTINFYDASFKNLGQITDSGSAYGICSGKVSLYKTQVIDGVSTLTLTSSHDPGIAFVRIGNATIADYGSHISTGEDMIVTINEEIE